MFPSQSASRFFVFFVILSVSFGRSAQHVKCSPSNMELSHLRIAFIYLTTVASKATSKTQLGNQETTVFSYLFLSAVLIFAPFVPFWCWHFWFLMFSHWGGWNHLWISQMLDKWYSLMKLTKTSRHFRNDDDLRVSYLGVKECDPVSEDQFDINGFATQIWQAAYVTNPHTSQASN